MARITLRQLLDHAAEHDYGLPAFNINNMEQGLAIMEAAHEPSTLAVIIQASRGARQLRQRHHVLAKMIDALAESIRTSRSACTRTTATARRPAPRPSSTASPR
jgi:fructose-bisphosphate aldolase class II